MLYTFRRMFLHRFLSVCILELQLHSKSLRFHRFNQNISIIHLENIIPRVQKLPQSCLKITQTYHPFTHHRALSEQSRETNHDDLCTLRKKWFFPVAAATRCIEHFSVGKLVPVSFLVDFPPFSPYPKRRPSDT